MIQKIAFFAFFSFLVLGFSAPLSAEDDPMLWDKIRVETKTGDIYYFDVELALTAEQQSKGLMERTYMAEDTGMMFIFPVIKERSFWMKNTLIPLDMFFIEHDGRIDHIHHMATPQSLASITSGRPVKAVLELNGGTADKLGLAVGDKIFHPAFGNELAQ